MARHLALLGFRSVYQARASRGPFDLVAHHGAGVLALQVQQAELPVHVPRPKVERLLQGAAELGWIPLLAIVSGGRPRFYAPQELRTTARSAVVEPGSPEIDSLLQLVLLAQPGR
ncbi:MAG: hypothetical protein FJ125_16855 [Deltaproteobacteria bacterium]|nr:hypothetical protein [Deltaproteobacteria bacterium]